MSSRREPAPCDMGRKMWTPLPDSDLSTRIASGRCSSITARAKSESRPSSSKQPSRSMHPMLLPRTHPRPSPTVEAWAAWKEDQVRGAVLDAYRPLSWRGTFASFPFLRGTVLYRTHRATLVISAGKRLRARCSAFLHRGEQARLSERAPPITSPHHAHLFIP